MPYADAMNKTLVFAIFDFDRFSKHDQIGEVKVPLCQIDLAQTIEEWRELQSVEGEGGQVISQLIRFAFNYIVNLLINILIINNDSPVFASQSEISIRNNNIDDLFYCHTQFGPLDACTEFYMSIPSTFD